MIVKILGALDVGAAITFLMMVFGIDVYVQVLLFFAFLLLIKGLFILGGEMLSIIDLISGILLIVSVFWTLPAIAVWIPALLLLSKGTVSFI